jgi:predicted NBD/HSP70 family sugar kinase
VSRNATSPAPDGSAETAGSIELPRLAGEPAGQGTVRRANLAVVLSRVASGAQSSRAQIAAETGLTRSTVSSLVGELIELGLVRETTRGGAPRGVGRPGVGLELSDQAVGVGLEINVDYLAVAVEDMSGRVLHERLVYVDNRRSAPEQVLRRLTRMAATALRAARAEGRVPVGVGLAMPGLVVVPTGTLLVAPNLGWRRLPLGEMLRDQLPGLPIRVDNESNLAAQAEHWRGAARDLRSFLVVFGQVGIGGGIFVDGEPYRGAHGFGGELGHMTLEPDGELCACGSRGCVETVAGQETIARRAGVPAASNGRARSITRQLVTRARRGDRATLDSLREAGRALGTTVASAMNLLDLEAVILGGCFGPLSPWLADEVADVVGKRVLAGELSPCAVQPSALGLDAAVRGAAVVSLRSVLAAPWIVHDLRAGLVAAAGGA